MRSDWLFLDSFEASLLLSKRSETQPDRPDRVSFETSTLEAPGIDIVS
jgi:hypothetical protein